MLRNISHFDAEAQEPAAGSWGRRRIGPEWRIYLRSRDKCARKLIMEIMSAPPYRPDAAPELIRRFGFIMAALMVVVAKRFVRAPLVVLNVPLWGWLSRTVQRFGRAVTRKMVVRPVPASRPESEAPRARGVRLPSRRGWLMRALGWEAAVWGTALETLLAEPDMQALVAARPGIGRLLRPLCRMLGVDGPGLALPVVVTEEVAARRRAQRRAARMAVWPRKGLPQLPKGAWFAPPVKNWGGAG